MYYDYAGHIVCQECYQRAPLSKAVYYGAKHFCSSHCRRQYFNGEKCEHCNMAVGDFRIEVDGMVFCCSRHATQYGDLI